MIQQDRDAIGFKVRNFVALASIYIYIPTYL